MQSKFVSFVFLVVCVKLSCSKHLQGFPSKLLQTPTDEIDKSIRVEVLPEYFHMLIDEGIRELDSVSNRVKRSHQSANFMAKMKKRCTAPINFFTNGKKRSYCSFYKCDGIFQHTKNLRTCRYCHKRVCNVFGYFEIKQ